MNELPAPLTPTDADLSDFPFMPIMIQRLKQSRSWLLCKRNPALAFYLLNVWTAAWHSKPAGSLEDDDLVLADVAMCSEAVFGELRADILRGWIRCRDGRLYHPIIADRVNHAWAAKLTRRAQTEAARAARAAKRAEGSVTENVTDDVTGSKGERDREGERDLRSSSLRSGGLSRNAPQKPTKPRKHLFPSDAFDRWYAAFPRKKARQEAERAFRKIEAADDTPFEALMAGIESFRRDNPDVTYWPYPATWLNGRRWTDEPSTAAVPAESGQPKVDFGGGIIWPEKTVAGAVDRWRDDPTTWPGDRIGPPPGQPGCRVPEHLLRMAA